MARGPSKSIHAYQIPNNKYIRNKKYLSKLIQEFMDFIREGQERKKCREKVVNEKKLCEPWRPNKIMGELLCDPIHIGLYHQ